MLREAATYHQSFLVEVDPQRFDPEWSILYAHQAAAGHSVVELEFEIVLKQFPERQGHRLAKCRLEDQSKRWCKVDVQGINIHHHLVKIKLDCVSECSANLTVGFAHHQWTGEQVPVVKGEPLEPSYTSGESPGGNDKRSGIKIVGWMLLTLVLVMLAIQLAEKVANKFDEKVQKDRMDSIREKRIPENHKKSEGHKKSE